MTHTRWRATLALLGYLALQPACGSDDGNGGTDGGGTGSGGSGGSGGGGIAVQLLSFTGPIAGDMLEAATQCERFGSPAPRLEVTLNGKVGATDRRLKITIQNYAGAGNYGGSALQVDIAGTTVSGDEASVAAGEKSGTVDSATNRDGNKVSGSWNCASTPVSK
jgi:hypothetical protein